MAPIARRREAWERLARDIDPAALEAMTTEVPLADAVEKAHDLMAGRIRGRVVVRI
jgi:acrylyl-CoA reductase (NADPH)